jgi:hypothetical protein
MNSPQLPEDAKEPTNVVAHVVERVEAIRKHQVRQVGITLKNVRSWVGVLSLSTPGAVCQLPSFNFAESIDEKDEQTCRALMGYR